MKKLLTILMVAGTISYATADEQFGARLVELKKIGKQQKYEWLTFTQEFEHQKFDIMKKHKDEWFNYGISTVKQWDTDPVDKNAIFKDQTFKALAIHKKHSQEWKDFYTKYQKDSEIIAQKHHKQTEEFEDSLINKDEHDVEN